LDPNCINIDSVGFTSGIIGELLPGLKKIDDFDFTNLGLSIGSALSTAFESIMDGSIWKIFQLQAENALMSIQSSPAMNSFAAMINVAWDAITGQDESQKYEAEDFDKYARAGLESNTELIDANALKISELLKSAKSKFEKKQSAAAGDTKPKPESDKFHPEDFYVPDAIIDAMVDSMDSMKTEGYGEDLETPQFQQVNAYQSRGLSLDANGRGNAVETTNSLLTNIRDFLKSAKTTKQLNW